MDKKALVSLLQSWENLTLMVKNIENVSEYLPAFMEIALTGAGTESWRAAWVADKINESLPGSVAPWIDQLTTQLQTLKHKGKKRQFLKLVSLYPIEAKHQSFLLDIALEAFTSESEPIAVRVYAMQVLYNLTNTQPGLKEEIFRIIEHELEIDDSPGVRSRGKKLIKQLRKEIKQQSSIS